MSHIINECAVNKFEGGGGGSQLYSSLPIRPESGCTEFTAHAKERMKTWRARLHESWQITALFESKQRVELKTDGVESSVVVDI